MLISYPVLPTDAAHADEGIYLGNVIEAHVIAHEGRYPISTLNTASGPVHRWHGGAHLYGGAQPIRAIADGTVVAFRVAAARENYEGLGEYDTSFVLIRHETQTGQNTTVSFYSLYMHLASRANLLADRLQQLPQWLREARPGPNVQTPAGQRVWRKDVLGFAGQLYGREACHFEVFATDAAFNAFWRDSTAVTQGAGSPDFFGDAHFVIPANQAFVARHPRAADTGAHRIDLPGPADFALPTGQAGNNTAQLFVSVELLQGRRIATTYEAGPDNTFVQVGTPVIQNDYEYELYRLATTLYPDCPSAGFEWLRFGRVLGPDTTTRAENWQLVRYSADAIGYLDLAPQAIAKLSDADFPHWRGWERRDEGQTANATDGICDDERTIALSQATSDASRRKVRHLICKAPSEWDSADLATRYARMREPGQPLESADSWTKFTEHVEKMAFWSQAGLGERSVWHFHPMQFVAHYRKCGWLNEQELLRCIPLAYETNQTNRNSPIVRSNISTATARTRVTQRDPIVFMAMCRKYCLRHSRLAHFLAQVYQETGVLRWSQELASGADYENRTDLGNTQRGDGIRFKGRGLIQTTGRTNYENYSLYRGKTGVESYAIEPNNLLLATNTFESADAAGLYWVSRSIGSAGINISRIADNGVEETHVRSVTRNVNGAEDGLWTGLVARRSHLKVTSHILLDGVTSISPEQVREDV